MLTRILPNVRDAQTRSNSGTRSRLQKTPNGPDATIQMTLTQKAFGGRVEIILQNGETITDEIAVADAHPLGARPFVRENYIHKFRQLAEPILQESEIERFLGLVERLPELTASEVGELNIVTKTGRLDLQTPTEGLF